MGIWRIGFFAGKNLLLIVLGLMALLVSPAHAAGAEPFVLGTDFEETSPMGKWYRRIYGEVFRRMGVPLSFVVMPTARLTILADQGEVDGQPSRVMAYAETHPNQIRVDEVLHEVRLGLYTFNSVTRPAQAGRIEDLASGKWLVEYRRGVAICEKLLKPLLPSDRISDVTSTDQGLKKLKSGRTDYYCDFDAAIRNEILTPEYKGDVRFRRALDLGVGIQLYPYVHKSRADLAPRLAETLRKVKAEGLVERYLREVEREAENVR